MITNDYTIKFHTGPADPEQVAADLRRAVERMNAYHRERAAATISIPWTVRTFRRRGSTHGMRRDASGELQLCRR